MAIETHDFGGSASPPSVHLWTVEPAREVATFPGGLVGFGASDETLLTSGPEGVLLRTIGKGEALAERFSQYWDCLGLWRIDDGLLVPGRQVEAACRL